LTGESAKEPRSAPERVGIAGSGAIACGLAAVAARCGPVVLHARSAASARRARSRVAALCERDGGDGVAGVEVSSDLAALDGSTFVVEAIAEDLAAKGALAAALGERLAEEAVLATTTSSLSIAELARASGRPDRFVGLHVFNPVTKMDLVEVVFPPEAAAATRARALAVCEALGKTAVEVPDLPGFVVNRLLFPFLFEAVRLMEETRLEPAAVDACLQLGAGHPMGPLALLDLVGLDVASSIGRTIGAEIPQTVEQLVAEGALGRKSGRGFYAY
jgi:3-hydroxybutyryl-CoA dehydrogenase